MLTVEVIEGIKKKYENGELFKKCLFNWDDKNLTCSRANVKKRHWTAALGNIKKNIKVLPIPPKVQSLHSNYQAVFYEATSISNFPINERLSQVSSFVFETLESSAVESLKVMYTDKLFWSQQCHSGSC